VNGYNKHNTLEGSIFGTGQLSAIR
jgi:hypothetical protein